MSAHAVEDIKRHSNRLRGSLLESLSDAVTGALRADDQTLIKYHGSYQQDDRDVREERQLQKLEPAYAFMIRTRTPGGAVSAEQWLKLDDIATRYAERGLRITTRQAFQFHGVIKRELKSTMQAINAALIDTIAACGDVCRNIAVGINPSLSSAHAAIQADAEALSKHLLPKSRAYYEIWLDEERVAGSGEEEEHIYGEAYLPRKFKIAFALPPINDVDVYTQDLGFTAILEHGELIGYDVSVGGGMGASHGDPETYPRLADVIGFITPAQVNAVAEAVVKAQRDLGNRAVRKRARLKYTIDDLGLARFKQEVEARAGMQLAPARGTRFEFSGDQFGWLLGSDGSWHLTLRLLSGRIWDRDDRSDLSALRELAQLLVEAPAAQFRLTANQNLCIAGIPAARKSEVEQLILKYQLDRHAHASKARLNAIACVALPTCGLAMAEAERYLPRFLDLLETALSEHGLSHVPIVSRISGCPNGCARPYPAEIALVGKAPGRYNLMLGGDHRGTRLNSLYRENIDERTIFEVLGPLLGRFARERLESEHFGDFLHRVGEVKAFQIPLKVVS